MSDDQISKSMGRGVVSNRLVRQVALISAVAILGLLAAAGTGVFSALQGARRRLQDVGFTSVQAFDEFLGGIQEDMLLTSEMLPITQDLDATLRLLLNRNDEAFETFLVSEGGQILAQRRRLGESTPRVSEQPWLPTVKAGEVFFGEISYEEYGVPFLNLAVPVLDGEGEFWSTLVVSVDMTALWDIVIGLDVGNTGYVYVTDAEGRILVHPSLDLVQSDADMESLTGYSPQGVTQLVFQPYKGVLGDRVLGFGTTLNSAPWYVIVEQPITEALRASVQLSIGLFALLVVVVILVYAFITFTRQRVVAPLTSLRAGVTRLQQGDLGYRVDLDQEDEFGALGDAFNSLVGRLQETIDSLEGRVTQRTQDLERRTVEMEAAAEVARDAAEIRDIDDLLYTTVNLISERFGFYHAGIFLIDESGDYAVLRAASSPGGRRMLARQHRLRVGRQGIVGYAAASGQSRIALDVGVDATHFANPDLPETRSEVALPLKMRDVVIGVLDVQSMEENAFSEEDVAILQTMADQIAVALSNARLIAETERSVRELERLYGEQAREAWANVAHERQHAYRYTMLGVEPTSSDALPTSAKSGLQTSEIRLEGDGRQLVAPIELRGQKIGSIVLRRSDEETPWDTEDRTLMEDVSAQVALALENARLLEESRQRAAREQLVTDITGRIRAELEIETVLQQALEDLGQVLDAERAVAHLRLDGDQQEA
jgi:GAF domain-containing protein/HAMP domain-containing protein